MLQKRIQNYMKVIIIDKKVNLQINDSNNPIAIWEKGKFGSISLFIYQNKFHIDQTVKYKKLNLLSIRWTWVNPL